MVAKSAAGTRSSPSNIEVVPFGGAPATFRSMTAALRSSTALASGTGAGPAAARVARAGSTRLQHLLAAAKAMPLSSSVMVSREEVTSLVQSGLESLPDELRQARWLLREREEFMAERKREADALMADVRAQAEHMVQRTEIVRQANSVAQRILDDANEEARVLRHQAEDFVDTKLAGMEIVLDRLTRTVQAGRAKLAAPLVGAATDDEGSRTEEDGFFDQDQS